MRMPFSRKGFPLACGCNRGEEDDKGSHCTMLSGDLPSGSHISRPRVLGRLRMSMAGLTDGATDPRREPSSCGRLGVLADTRPHVFLCQDFLAVIGAVAELAFLLSFITTVACSPTTRRSAGIHKGSHCTTLSGDLPSGSHISRPRIVDADVDFVTIQMLFASIARICQTGGTGFAPTCLVTVRKHPLHLESCVRLWYSFTCAIASAWS